MKGRARPSQQQEPSGGSVPRRSRYIGGSQYGLRKTVYSAVGRGEGGGGAKGGGSHEIRLDVSCYC